MPPSALESLLIRDRLVVVAVLCAVVFLSAAYLLAGAGMPAMPAEWSAPYFGVMLAMWAAMMAAMMLPSAAPMILLHISICRRRAGADGALATTALFLLGYLATWVAFSLAATALQWALASAALLSPMLASSSEALAASLFVAAGIYQWTPLKQSCLRRCRSPLDFLITYWRSGRWGSFAMGLRHGAFCLGCCWLLMLLLFAGGLMNLLWIAGLAAFVLIEKLSPAGHWISRAAGTVLAAWGVFALAGVHG